MRNIQESISRLDTAISRHDGMTENVADIPRYIREKMIDRLMLKYIDGLSLTERINLQTRAKQIRDMSDSEIIKRKSGIQDKAEYIAFSAAEWLLSHSQ